MDGCEHLCGLQGSDTAPLSLGESRAKVDGTQFPSAAVHPAGLSSLQQNCNWSSTGGMTEVPNPSESAEKGWGDLGEQLKGCE